MHSIRSLVLALTALFALGLTPTAARAEGPSTAPATASAQDPAPSAAAAAPSEEAAAAGPGGWQASLNSVMAQVNGAIESVIFFPIPVPFTSNFDAKGAPTSTKFPIFGGETSKITIPFAVLWLVIGAIFFTIRAGFPQLRALGHAIQVVRGKYDDPKDTGDVTSFQALSAALSATVGLGNIGGVATAIAIGGPGATFWMIIAGFLGMASKFTECTLGQMYRQTRSDGSVMGGAMYYLSQGLADRGLPTLGKVLAVTFTILCIGGSFGGGNSYQVNASLAAIGETMPFLTNHGWVYGLVMVVAVGVVILGGIKRIADVASTIVPLMCVMYVLAALVIIVTHAADVPAAFGKIIEGAFAPTAIAGGAFGVLIQGFKRAAFSNEAGVGSAAIAHSAAKTPYPVREGIVSLLEPFIDTIVVCTMTALVIVITGAYTQEGAFAGKAGAALTSAAFGEKIGWFPYVLSVAVALFAFSTMISWSYYGERCWVWLFGDGTSLAYRCIFLVFTFLGSVITAQAVIDFGDLMILGMAIPNVLGLYFLAGKVRAAFVDYWARLKTGEIQPMR
ncbi:MAG: alanine/glycine:cation symporter family protein [Planctomycetota bacterium]